MLNVVLAILLLVAKGFFFSFKDHGSGIWQILRER